MSRQLNWVNIGWLFLSPAAALVLVPVLLYHQGFSWMGLLWFTIACLLPSLSITGGYHRLFSHRSYEASAFVRLCYLLCGAANFQGSALQWASDHRRHHRHVDTDADPYSINKGFFYAHMGWLFRHEASEVAGVYPPDLKADPLVMWQHRYYVSIAIAMGFFLPMGVGFLIGNPWGGLIIGGLARVVFCQHSTFLINSLSHYAGRQNFTLKTSARDNLLMAFLAFGEGWHSFHHRFQSDYRNGFRWYHWDPTKWLISSLHATGLAWRLKTVPAPMILQARMQTEQQRLLLQGVPQDRLTALKARFDAAQARFWEMYTEYGELKRRVGEQSRLKILQMRAELKIAKLERKMALAQWCAYVRTMRAVPAYR